MNEVAANDTPTRRWASGTSPSAYPQATTGGGVNALGRRPGQQHRSAAPSHGGVPTELTGPGMVPVTGMWVGTVAIP